MLEQIDILVLCKLPNCVVHSVKSTASVNCLKRSEAKIQMPLKTLITIYLM